MPSPNPTHPNQVEWTASFLVDDRFDERELPGVAASLLRPISPRSGFAPASIPASCHCIAPELVCTCAPVKERTALARREGLEGGSGAAKTLQSFVMKLRPKTSRPSGTASDGGAAGAGATAGAGGAHTQPCVGPNMVPHTVPQSSRRQPKSTPRVCLPWIRLAPPLSLSLSSSPAKVDRCVVTLSGWGWRGCAIGGRAPAGAGPVRAIGGRRGRAG